MTMALLAADDNYAKQVYELMQENKVAMVSTVYTEKETAKPYGSVMPVSLVPKEYWKEQAGSPYVFISDLATHTHNIEENPNVSIMVFKPDENGNVFNGSRVTYSGKLVKATDETVIEGLRKHYLVDHPDAEEFIDFGDFNFYVLEIEDIYFIGGFGEIGHVEVDDYRKVAE